MRAFNFGVAGAVVGVFLFGSVGGVSAIEPFDLNSVSLQYQREVRSTYIIQFQPGFDATEVQGRANAIAARFQGRLRHTYTRALSGFAIRMNAAAMANLLDADDLRIASISRGVIMHVAQSNDNAAPQARKVRPPKEETSGTCPQILGWNISRVTSLSQNEFSTDLTSCDIMELDSSSSRVAATSYSDSTLNVCVLDTGVSLHPDINLFARYVTVTGSDNLDDGYGHGTHVAGIIGAIAYGNNLDSEADDIGVVGVAPGVPIISIKVLNDDGFGSDFDILAGIDKALAEGCDIVNMSLGGSKSIPLDIAIKLASSASTAIGGECLYEEVYYDRKGNVVVTDTERELCLDTTTSTQNIIFTLSAGNSARDIEDYSPARNSTSGIDNIFTIASFGNGSGDTNVWSSFSNYGEDVTLHTEENESMVDFALPGSGIRSTLPNNKYATYNGTSMSAPHMAGLLVRYIDRSPTTYECADTNRRCVTNADVTPDLYGTVTRITGFKRFTTPKEKYDVAADK